MRGPGVLTFLPVFNRPSKSAAPAAAKSALPAPLVSIGKATQNLWIPLAGQHRAKRHTNAATR
jgi:hypothetical protein